MELVSLASISFAAALLLASAVPAQATVPGGNGRIAYAQFNSDDEIYVMNADGSNQTNITNNSAYDLNPSWSPDGTKIAFSSNRTGNYEIFVMNPDGSNPTNVSNNTATDDYPSWSPDGTKIAFTSNRTGNNEIFVMNADGSNPTNVSNNTATDNQPSWSPDGTKIAFTSNRTGDSEIFVMNADGSNQTNVSNNTATDGHPSWSPDGTKIAFGSDRTGQIQVFVMNADGSNQTNLSIYGGGDEPSWSPDGTKIAFLGPAGSIYVMNADGSNHTPLTTSNIDFAPSWQPLPSADLALSLGATPTRVGSGQPLTYTITVYDHGPWNANGVVVSDQLPPDVRFVSAKPSAGGNCTTPASWLVQCTLGLILNKTSLAEQIVVTVVANDTTFNDTASVTSYTSDPNLANNSTTITTQATDTITGPAPTTTVPAATVTSLRVSPSKFKLTGRRVKGRCVKATAKNQANKRCTRPVAIKVSYTLTGPASVRFVVGAHGSITLTGKTGNNTFIFNGKIGGHKLGPGTYRLTATLTGGSSRTVTFRIVR